MKTLKQFLLEQLLLEANYEEMFAKFEDSRCKELAKDEIEWAKSTLKKNDRIVWYLKFIQMRCRYMTTFDKDALRKDLEAIKAKSSEPWSGGIGYLVRLLAQQDEFDFLSEWETEIKNHLENFYALKAPAIEKVQFRFQSPLNLFKTFRQLEHEYLSERRGYIADDELEQRNTTLIEYPNKWRWVNLNRSWCSKEGRAGKHCGNYDFGQLQPDDRLVSLRQPIEIDGEVFWKPHLSFVIYHGGILADAKKSGNVKPDKKYHDQIVDLLLNKTFPIHGVFPPDNKTNFLLDDLEPEKLDMVLLHNKYLKAEWELLDDPEHHDWPDGSDAWNGKWKEFWKEVWKKAQEQ